MSLKKPSELFNQKPKNKIELSSYDSNSLPENFDVYKSNIKNIEILNDFTDSFGTFKDNIQKVDNLEKVIHSLKEEFKSLIKKEDLDNAIMSNLLVLEKNIEKIELNLKGINRKDLNKIEDEIEDISNKVLHVLEEEFPKYKKSLKSNEIFIKDKFYEHSTQVDEKLDKFNYFIENSFEKIEQNLQFINKNQLYEITDEVKNQSQIVEDFTFKSKNQIFAIENEVKEFHSKVQNILISYQQSQNDKIISLEKNISLFSEEEVQKYQDLLKETKIYSEKKFQKFEHNLAEKYQKLTQDIEEKGLNISNLSNIFENLENNLYDIQENYLKKEDIFKEINDLKNLFIKKLNLLENDISFKENRVKEANKKLTESVENVSDLFQELNVKELKQKYNHLTKKILYVEEVFSKFNEKVVIDESLSYNLPSAKTSDPLTPLNKNYVTLDQLQQHYRLFINRVQQQLTTLGGGGETQLKYLDDIIGIATNASAYDGKFLKYNHSNSKFEFSDVDITNDAWADGVDGPFTYGQVGIGTSAIETSSFPGNKLIVYGNARITGILSIGTGSITLDPEAGSIKSGETELLNPTGGANYIGIVSALQFSTGQFNIGINSNTITGPATFTIDPITIGDNTGLVVIDGNLNVNASTRLINVNVSGVSTLGITTATNLTSQSLVVSGISTLGITSTTNLTTQSLVVSGISTLGITSATNLTTQSLVVSGIITATDFHTGEDGYFIRITSNTISGPQEIIIDPYPVGVGTTSGSVRIKGDLYVDGTQTIINSTTIDLADFRIGIGITATNDVVLDGAGIGIGSVSNQKTLTWNNSSTALKSSEDFDIASNKVYKINGTSVLSSDTLGSGVTASSLTSLGTITNLASTNGTITTLNSTNGTITNLTGTAGTITTLNSTNGTITTLNSTNGTITNLTGTAGTITTLNSTNGTITNLTGTAGTITNLTATNINISGISTINSISITKTTSQELIVTGVSTLGITSTTNLTSQQLKVSGITTLGSSSSVNAVTIGLGNTLLHVDGNARITGILSIGQGTVTIDGNANTITSGQVTISGSSITLGENVTINASATGINSAPNVLYVAKDGSDSNTGTSIDNAKLTVVGAVSIAQSGTVIKVLSGNYVEINPIVLPAFTAVVGDDLRTVKILPNTITSDIFHVNKGCKLANMTFSGHVSPAAAVAFPIGIATNVGGGKWKGPYIQNCTSDTTTGTGIYIDGNRAEQTKSMNVDAFTQYNQGGIGIAITNEGYAQLVSVFTICCDKAITVHKGGQADVSNSNCSFGTFGLIADGVSNQQFIGTITSSASESQDQITINLGNVTTRPYNGQVVYFDQLYKSVDSITVGSGGTGYTQAPIVSISSPSGPNGQTASAFATIENGSVSSIFIISGGNQYTSSPIVTISAPQVGINTATVTANMSDIYYTINSSTPITSGITTLSIGENLINTIGIGSTAYFFQQSKIIASSHTFEYVGSGNDITSAIPKQGGITIQENEVVSQNGGRVIYTSTDQAGNFRIGDDLKINQATGTISGRAFSKSLFAEITPFILALS